ncbi:MAG: endonuclease/exonuclease/phosphatase family protein [Methylotenera sp.]|nr:endonuclease/exonuclease/phosphatase family protein [Oligoflexia bacterium]
MQYKVATYNVGLLKILWHEAVPLAFSRSDLLVSRLPAIAAEQGIEIFALQEVWTAKDRKRFKIAFEKNGYASVETPRKGWLGTGLLLFVHHSIEILEENFHPFKGATSWDRWVQKGMLSARIRKPGTPTVAVINTHLQALTTDRSRSARRLEIFVHNSQVQQLKTLVNHSNSPTILLGDFNVGPTSYASLFRKLLRRLGTRDVLTHVPHLKLPEFLTWDQNNPLVQQGHLADEKSARLDHCMVRPSADWDWHVAEASLQFDAPHPELRIRGQTTPLSDHFAVVVRLELLARTALNIVHA